VTSLQFAAPSNIQEARQQLQIAISVEFGTLPPYLYSLYSIRPGTNDVAAGLIRSVVMQEMVHMCLAANILNAIGGNPELTPPEYPGQLPGHIGPDGRALTVSLLPFSEDAMQQGMNIERPEDPPDFPVVEIELIEAEPRAVTIGQFYQALDRFLATLPTSAWTANRNQIDDRQFLTGQIFSVNGYTDARRAISTIVSEGEGTGNNPLDFAHEVAHFFRFGEIFHNKVLTKTTQDPGYQWGPEPLGVDWDEVYPAISDPQTHNFGLDPPAAQAAQSACNHAYSQLVDALQNVLTGQLDQLGIAVRAMFDLGMNARVALTTQLADGESVSGPAFRYVPDSTAKATA
jgi:hypothetical protein